MLDITIRETKPLCSDDIAIQVGREIDIAILQELVE